MRAPLGPLLLCSAAAAFELNHTVRSSTSHAYVAWNLDSSADRQFFTRDLTDPQLRYLTKEFGNTTLRFGGTGNDVLTYAFGDTQCSGVGCLNATQWDALAALGAGAGMEFVFGLNIMKRLGGNGSDSEWDPTNARELMQYSKAKGYKFFGFELGNEKNLVFSGASTARSFAKLQQLLEEEYPDAATRPKMMGPDEHSFHANGGDKSLLQFVTDFADAAREMKLPLHAITHHEYIEVDKTSSFSPATLDMTRTIAESVRGAVSAHLPGAEVWAGEIGPHNAGQPPCDHSSMRWASYANAVWYADALGTKAHAGYQKFCRQDFAGADYGLVDCSTNAPLPDYYTGLLYKRLMGKAVLGFAGNDNRHSSVRAYAHCSRDAAGVTVLLINLHPSATDVPLSGVGLATDAARVDYILTPGADGVNGTRINLNGAELVYTPLHLPAMPGAPASGTTVHVPAHGMAFVQFPGADVAACL